MGLGVSAYLWLVLAAGHVSTCLTPGPDPPVPEEIPQEVAPVVALKPRSNQPHTIEAVRECFVAAGAQIQFRLGQREFCFLE